MAWTADGRMAAHIPDRGSFVGLPYSGTAVQPSLSIGGNLERLFRTLELSGISNRISSPLSPERFELHAHFVHQHTQDHDIGHPREQSARGVVRSRGMELRYHLLMDSGSSPSDVFRFLGLSVTIGYHGTHGYLKIREPINRVTYLPYQQTMTVQPVIWDLENTISMKSKLTALPLEFRSGITCFNIIDLYLGLGVVRHKGNGRASTVGLGPVYYDTNLQGAIEGEIIGASVHADALLAMLLSGQTIVELSRGFGRIGIEVGSQSLRVGIESVFDDRAHGIHLSLSYRW